MHPALERAALRAAIHATRDRLRQYRPTFGVDFDHADGRGPQPLYRAQPKQDELHGHPAPNILYGGQAGGGKSRGMRWDAIIKALRVPGLRILLVRRTFPELEKTHLLELPRELPAGMARILKRTVKFPNGSFIQFGHCKDMKALSQYLSSEWDLIYVDEAQTFLPDMLVLLRNRLRTTNQRIRPQFICSANPGGDAHSWLVQMFIERRPPADTVRRYDPTEWHFISASVTDNAYIQDDYLDRLLELPEPYRSAFLYGRWDLFAGQFFPEWRPALHGYNETEEPVAAWWEAEGAMDWGYSPNPAVLYGALYDEDGRPWVHRELVFRECTPGEVAQGIHHAFPPDSPFGRMLIRCDPSAFAKNQAETGVPIADAINEALAALGSAIVLVRANNDRINGWMRVKSYLKPRPGRPPGIRVNLEACPYLVSTIGAQVHHDTIPGDMKKGPTDHGCDALRYLLMAREIIPEVPPEQRPGVALAERLAAKRKQLMRDAMARHTDAGNGDPGADDPEMTPAGAGDRLDDPALEQDEGTLGDVWQ